MIGCLAWNCITPSGDLQASLSALSTGKAQPGPLPGHLQQQLNRLFAPMPTEAVDGIILATTKGDCHTWREDLLATNTGQGGPSAIAADLAARFQKPCYVVSMACASGPAALAEAARRIESGLAQTLLVCAIDRFGPFVRAGFGALGALDPSGAHPFDANRAGLSLGETMAAMIVGTEPGTAVQLQGWGASCDANHLTGPHREGAGLAQACKAACGSERPDLVIGHGTGTTFNDDSESLAYASLWPDCTVVGWKGGLGHSLGACGLTEVVLGCECLLSELPIPGTQGLRQQGCAGAVNVLPEGENNKETHSFCSANAGFGGLNAAVFLRRQTTENCASDIAAQAAPAPQEQWSLTIDHAGWHGVCSGTWTHPLSPGELPKITSKELFQQADASWGRLDRSSRLLVALLHKAQQAVNFTYVDTDAWIINTNWGCAESDQAFESERRSGLTSRQRFPYTLPSTPLGEASIRLGFRGLAQVMMGASAKDIRDSITALRHTGHSAVYEIRLETYGTQQHASLHCWR